jgi:hypothetical protein
MKPIIINKVTHKGITLQIEPPLILQLSLGVDDCISIECPDLDLYYCSTNKNGREKFRRRIIPEDLVMLWREYALEKPKNLDREAKKLRLVLLKRFKEVK